MRVYKICKLCKLRHRVSEYVHVSDICRICVYENDLLGELKPDPPRPKEPRKIFKRKPMPPVPKEERLHRPLFYRLRNRAKKLEIPFEMDLPGMVKILKVSCCYCNGDSSSLGLSDKDTGYITSNVFPVCSRCSVMKKNMTQEEFRSHIRLIFTHWA